MSMRQMDPIQYSIFDPTGNITALVESPVEPGRQPSVAAGLMARHPEVEQVGFVRLVSSSGDDIQAELRMAGGEFCGNASMSAAALVLLRRTAEHDGLSVPSDDIPASVRLHVSGAARPVEVRLWKQSGGSFRAGVHMPPALGVIEREFVFGTVREILPVVRMEGISHIIIESGSAFFRLRQDHRSAEQAIRNWCGALSAEGLGLMFLEGSVSGSRLTPLVFVPGCGTVFWENSCASGSSAAGMYLAAKSGLPTDLSFLEPGGRLRVRSDPIRSETWLYGETRMTENGIVSPVTP